MDPSSEEIDGALDQVRFGELAYDLGPEGAHELVQEFLSLTPASIAGLREAAENDDGEALARAAHQLRGGCLSIGAMHLALACGAAERAVRAQAQDGEEAGAADGLDAHADAIDRAWQATRIALLRTLP